MLWLALLFLIPLLLLVIAVVAAAPDWLARALLWLERRPGALRSRRIGTDSIDWHYLDGGRGEPLVMLHGFNADGHHFTRLARRLRGHQRILAPDLPGFGRTGIPSRLDFSIECQARRVLAWADAIGIEQFDLGGNSMGGYIAVALARMAPQRVRALCLLAPGGLESAPYSEVFREIERGAHNPLIVRHRDDFERLIDYCFVRRPFIPAPVRCHLARRAAASQMRARTIFDAMRHHSARLETLAEGLETPTLVIWGDGDRVLHPGGLEVVAGKLAHCRTERLAGIGHLPMLENPRRVAELWLQFQRDLPDKAPSQDDPHSNP